MPWVAGISDRFRAPATSGPPPPGPSHSRARCQSPLTAASADSSSARRASPTASARPARSASAAYSRAANTVAAVSRTDPSQPITAGTPAVTSAVASDWAASPPPASPPLRPPPGGRPSVSPLPVAVRHADTNSSRGRAVSSRVRSPAVVGRPPPVSSSIISAGTPGFPGRTGQLLCPWHDRCTTGIPPSSASRCPSCTGSPLSSTTRSTRLSPTAVSTAASSASKSSSG